MLKGKLTITTPSSLREEGVEIRIRDEKSRINFITARVSYKDLMQALTGLAEVPMEFELNKPENVGKHKEYQHIRVSVNRDVFYSENMEAEIMVDITDHVECFYGEGWEIQDPFGRQNTFCKDKTGDYVNVTLYRYV